MVKGLEVFRERFRQHEGSFVLIGGAACHEWFAAEGLEFRPTKDLDIVLIVEVLDPSFVAAIRAFVSDGGYEIRRRTSDQPILYRFAKPTADQFPAQLEFFSRRPDGRLLHSDQDIIPIASGMERHSLSAILLEDDYYALIQDHQTSRDGLPVVTAAALIPLKACAWLNLSSLKAQGEHIDSREMNKHRNDVFALASTLPGTPGPQLPPSILADLSRFIGEFSETSPEWTAIRSSLKHTFSSDLQPSTLLGAIQTYYRMSP